MGERADPTHNLIKFGGFSGKLTLYHRSKSPPPVEDQEDAHGPQKHLRFETNVGLNNLQWLHHDLYHFPGMVEKFHMFSFSCCFLIHFSKDGKLQEKSGSLAKFSTLQFHQSLYHLSFCKDSSKKWRWLGCF